MNTDTEADRELSDLRKAADDLRKPYAAEEGMPQEVYHYCSMNGAIEILPSKTFRASNIAHSNDPSEVMYGHRIIREVVQSKFPLFAFRGVFRLVADIDFYAVCFSAEGDLLPQWRAYCGNGRGLSIGVPTSVLAQHKSMLFVRMEYDPAKQRQLAEDTIRIYEQPIIAARASGNMTRLADLAGDLALHFVVLTGMFKSPAYDSEREYRLFNTLPRPWPAHQTTLKFRTAGGTGALIVPFYDVPLMNSGAAAASAPFSNVIIGPCMPVRTTKTGLRLLLDQASLPAVTLTRSEVRMTCS